MAKLEPYLGTFADDTAVEAWLTAHSWLPAAGHMYKNTTTGWLRIYDGVRWTEFISGNAAEQYVYANMVDSDLWEVEGSDRTAVEELRTLSEP